MGVKSKGRRRLLMLLAASVVGVSAVGGWVLVRRQMITTKALQAREVGMEMAKAGDYAHALEPLGQYVGRFPNDKEALFQYATARENVEMPNARHLSSALGAWKQLVLIDPDNVEVHQKLMRLYGLMGYNAERLEVIASLQRLSKDPVIVNETWRAKAEAYLRMNKVREAREAITTATEKDPTNMEGQTLAVQIMLARGASMDDVVAYTTGLLSKYPNDPRFEILQADVYLRLGAINQKLGDQNKSREWIAKAAEVIKSAASHEISDILLLQNIVLRLDVVGAYDQGVDLCERSFKRFKDVPAYKQMWVMRLFYAGRLDAVLDEVGGTSEKEVDSELLAIKAMALIRKGKDSEAAITLDALDKRTTANKNGVALGAAVRAVWLQKDGDLAKQAEVCRASLAVAPQSAVLHNLLGEALNRFGETELAVRQWQIAIDLSPGWSTPFVQISRVRLEQGQLGEALVMAEAARDRAHESREELTLFATVCSLAFPKERKLDLQVILQLCSDIEKKFPDTKEIYPAHVHLLAQLDRREEAVKLGRGVISATPSPDAATLLKLAQVSRADKLGFDEACFDVGEKTYGLSPELAFAKALWMLSEGKGADGLKYIRQAVVGKTGVEWRMTEVRYLDVTRDSGSLAGWASLMDAYPKNVQVMRAAMASPAVRRDHDLMGKAIDRIREVVGAENIETQIARAQWLLQVDGGKEPPEKDLAEATSLLSDVTRLSPELLLPRLLLAACMEKLKNTSGAIEQYRAAGDLAPKAAPRIAAGISMSLARLLLAQGDMSAARQQLGQVDVKLLSPVERQQLAGLMAGTRDFAAATQLLETSADSVAGYVMLGRLYYSAGQIGKIDNLAKKILAEKSEAGGLLFVAEFYASQNRELEAEQVLRRLKSMEGEPKEREGALAAYLVNHGTVDEAVAQLVVAARAGGAKSEGWRVLFAFCIAKGRMDDILLYLPEAITAAGADPCLTVLNSNKQILKNIAADPMAQVLCAGLINSPADAPAIGEALAILADQKLASSMADRLLKLRPLADRYANILPIQLVIVQNHMRLGQNDQAASIAQRLMKLFPNSSEAAELAYQSLAGANRWAEALEVAKDWRQRLGQSSLPGDLAHARALMATGKVDEGMAIIQPLLAAARKNPDGGRDVIILYAQGMIAKRQANLAAVELEPLLKSVEWRSTWITLATTLSDLDLRASWLEKVEKLIPPNATGELAQLAMAWSRLTEKSGNQAHGQHARAIIDSLVKLPDADANILFMAGTLAEQGGDPKMAEQLYRRALSATPDNDTRAMTSNNLAMVLVNKNDQGKLPEAMDLINVSVKLAPKFANFYDTKATVSAAAKGYKEGMSAIEEAIKIEPSNPEWRATKIWLLGLMGDKTRAQVEYQQMNMLNVSRLSPDSRKRLTEVGFK